MGKIRSVEADGTFVNPNIPCYDIAIINKEENALQAYSLYKHVLETQIVGKVVPSTETIFTYERLGL